MNVNDILNKFEESINSYNEFENICFYESQWHELRSISIEKLIKNQDIDELWKEKCIYLNQTRY